MLCNEICVFYREERPLKESSSEGPQEEIQ